MAVNDVQSALGAGEETPLLSEQARREDLDDRSSETLTDSSRAGDEEEVIDSNKANQHVGRRRGLLIILSLWGLIFLQGRTVF